MASKIRFASIDEGYSLYYIPGDSEGRWIITDDAGVACTNYNIPEELAEVAAKAKAMVAAGEGVPAQGYDEGILEAGPASEAERLMVEWGWLVPALLSTADAAKALDINERRVRQLCQDGRMGQKVGDTWVITLEDIERNRERKPGRPAVAYERIGSWGGYKVRKAPTGFVVEHWSAHTDELTDDKYLLPYGKAAGGYGKDADLSADHNDLMTIGDFLYHEAPFEGRVLRKGRILR